MLSATRNTGPLCPGGSQIRSGSSNTCLSAPHPGGHRTPRLDTRWHQGGLCGGHFVFNRRKAIRCTVESREGSGTFCLRGRRCEPGPALSPLVFLLTETMRFSADCPGSEEAASFSRGPECQGLHNGSAESNRLFKTYGLSQFGCVHLLFFSVKRKETVLPRTQHMLSLHSHSAALELAAVVKTSQPLRSALPSSHCLPSRGQWVGNAAQLILPVQRDGSAIR